MRADRGASQVLFGMLPTQTVDLQGGIWQVREWVDPEPLTLDNNAVRRVVLDAMGPWVAAGQDGGTAGELHGGAHVEVVAVNSRRGVLVERFPPQWRCRSRTCGRITSQRPQQCRCGSTAFAQMHYVAYHECGRIREPLLRRCPTHNAVAVRMPGTASARELYFYCPECRAPLSNGFGYQRCDCGEAMAVTVHRAGAVFTPHYAVLVNPSDAAAAERLRAMGGGARALQWLIDGMGSGQAAAGRQTVDGLIEALTQQGISRETARDLAEQALERGEVTRGSEQGDIDLPDDVRGRAQDDALSLWAAVDAGRRRIADMIAGTTPPLRLLYEEAYPRALERCLLANVDLLTDFPVATLAFGYTRGGLAPGESQLVTFRERGALRAYGSLVRTEALLFQLDPVAIYRYLVARGFELEPAQTARDARLSILRAARTPNSAARDPQTLGVELLTVVHSYAHRLIRTLAAFAGIERDALAEYLIPNHLSIVVYAAARGEFVLGGLQAVFETSLDRFLDSFVNSETRCPLDPGCRSGGGACVACLHLGEPSCRWYNQFLDRSSLFYPEGLLRRHE